ncbi:MAG: redoxin domain-containing protein [Deltaproteobacteria bacterium]|nr:redoxin domain-containing protein [Deltaproteobacteria bacterium]
MRRIGRCLFARSSTTSNTRPAVKSGLAVIVITAFILACGAPAATDSEGPAPDIQVDFTYELNGKPHRISELRGRPVVVVLMRTSEMSSQAYMLQVADAFRQIAGRTRFLVLTIEPSEAPFTEMYVVSEKLPFPIGLAEDSVARGLSSLGVIPIIPTTYIIDASGHIADAAAGRVRADDIVRAVNALP